MTERTLFLRSDGVHAFKTRFSLAREELLRRDATGGGAQPAGGQGDQAARAGGGALQGLGGQEPRPQQAQERGRDAHRPHRGRAHRRPTSRASASLELSDGEIDAKVALRLAEPRRHGAGRRRKLIGHRPAGRSPPATAWRCWARTARASRPCCRRWPPPTIRNWSTTTARRAIRFNPSCRLVYFDQTHARPAARDDDPRLCRCGAEGVSEKDAIRLLAQAGFAFARIRQPIGVLSHGERARLVFLRMKLLRPNFYLLDEPTNHLDIEGQEALGGRARADRGLLPLRLARPLLHPHGRDALPRDPQGPAGRGRERRRLLRRPVATWAAKVSPA